MTIETTIDRTKLRADTNALARECRALKDLLGVTWTRPMSDEQRRQARLRARATELCVLRAWSRGRQHVRTAPHGSAPGWDASAWHERIATRVAKDYAVAPVAEAPVAAETNGAAR